MHARVRVPVPRIQDPALIARRVVVEARHVGFIRGILEASEGLACLFAERGGDLLLVTPAGRINELDALIEDLKTELGAIVPAHDVHGAQMVE